MAICLSKVTIKKIHKLIDDGAISSDTFLNDPTKRIEALNKILPEKQAEALNERFARRYGAELLPENVDDIIKANIKIKELENAIPENSPSGSIERKNHARAVDDFNEVVRDIVSPTDKLNLKDTVYTYFKKEAEKIADQPTYLDSGIQGVKSLVGTVFNTGVKGIKAGLDLSYALRQGFKTFTKDMADWATTGKNPHNFSKSIMKSVSNLKNIGSREASEAMMKEFRVSIIASKYFDKAMDGGLALGVTEDYFPSSIASKIPVLGNLFKASDDAFNIFTQSARMGQFENIVQNMERKALAEGRELTAKELKDAATVANSITSRGSFGKYESLGESLNNLFYSARFIKSQADTFLMPFNKKLSTEARKEATKVLVSNLATIGTLMATASAFGEVEWDPRSSKFGKVKLEGTDRWFDLTAGLGSYITLASRVAGKTKNSKGDIVDLNSGKFGARTYQDVVTDFFENKLAPQAQAINDIVFKGETFEGEKPTISSTVKTLYAPMTAENIYDYLTNEDMATALGGTVVEALGISSTDYGAFKKNK